MATRAAAHTQNVQRGKTVLHPRTPITGVEEITQHSALTGLPEAESEMPMAMGDQGHPEADSQEVEMDQLLALASRYGYALQPTSDLKQELANSVLSKMIQRLGDQVYQVVSCCIPFPKQTAKEIFDPYFLTEESANRMTWTLSTCAAISSQLGPIFATQSVYSAAGATRIFQPKSAPVVHVVATLMRGMEITHESTTSGADRLHLNFMYALVTENGEKGWPKDSKRREMIIPEEEEQELDEEVWENVRALADQGHRLSPAWWRQLGEEERAVQTETELAQPRVSTRERKVRISVPRKPPKPKRRARFTKETYEISKILMEKKVSSKEKVHFLVEWAEYNEAWEPSRATGQPGDPLTTWEPLLLMQGTEALQEWRAGLLLQAASS